MERSGKSRIRRFGWILLGLLAVLCFLMLVVKLVRAHQRQQAGAEFWEQAAQFDESKQPWVECVIPLPERPERLVFRRRLAHPFLAEYRRRIRIERAGAEDVTLPLPMNVGGRTHINVYWIAEQDDLGPFVLLRDYWGDYLVDLAADQTLQIERHLDRVYVGVVRTDPNGNVGTVGSGLGPTSAGASGRRDITDDGILDHATYLGRIDGRTGPLRYVPADEAAEEKIEK